MGQLFSSPVVKDDHNKVQKVERVDYNKVEFLDQEGDVRRVICCLEQLKDVDIIVNSTDKSLSLDCGGAISKTILKHAGPRIQEELNKKYPSGIAPGKIAVTDGYNLPYKFVFHCSLQNIEERISHHLIREIVTACLQKVKKMDDGPFSIAFPVIGAGAMKFNRRLLKTIYRTILEFMYNKSGALKLAYIIIYPGNTQVKEYALYIRPEKEKERISYQVSFPRSWPEGENIRRIKLKQSDDDYLRVAAKFRETIFSDIEIIKIERIVNKRLYVTSRWHRNKFPKCPTQELWHGTTHDAVDGIIRYGFDWRLVKTHVFGKGCYFCDKAFYSDGFSPPNDQDEQYMFLVDVTVGKTITGKDTLTEMNLADTVQTATGMYKHKHGAINIFVTFDDDQIYPLFLIVYKKNVINNTCTIM